MNYKTNQKYGKIAIEHSLFFFALTTISIITIKFVSISNDFIYLICFFLISTIGIAHGALDNLKGKKLLKIYKIKNIIFFYLFYILLALFVATSWISFPGLTLFIFLIIACYHFGKEDTFFFLKDNKFIDQHTDGGFANFTLFLKGLLIVVAPLKFNPDETRYIFEILAPGESGVFLFYIIEILFFLSCITYLWFFFTIESPNNDAGASIIFDFLSIILLNYFLSPLIAFTLYFCFLHSIRHSISLILIIDKRNLRKGAFKFIKKALPLTLVTAIVFVVSVLYLKNHYAIDVAILKVIFIGLASLTFPHILLEYLVEKNEK